MKKICVIGSLNMDLVASMERFPQPGETLTGKQFGVFPGGKGANQAVAAGRLQADVRMIGKVGDDVFGERIIANLKENGINAEGLGVAAGLSSGVAVIEVDGSGENHIVIIPGANGGMDRSFLDQRLEFMLECDIFLLQLEIPIETVAYVVKKLKEHGKTIILDPAPARSLPAEIFENIDYITPNETEIAILSNRPVQNETDIAAAALELLNRGVGQVILKAGKRGAFIIRPEETVHIPGFKVTVVDTTGAGDSFNAGLAVSLAQGLGLAESVRFANAVGALATTAQGAQIAMPRYEQVTALIHGNRT